MFYGSNFVVSGIWPNQGPIVANELPITNSFTTMQKSDNITMIKKYKNQ